MITDVFVIISYQENGDTLQANALMAIMGLSMVMKKKKRVITVRCHIFLVRWVSRGWTVCTYAPVRGSGDTRGQGPTA